MEKKKILITDRFSQDALLLLQQQPFFEIEKREIFHLKPEDLQGVHGIITRSRTFFTRDVLKAAKSLQVLVTSTSGFDHIDLRATEDFGIAAMHTPNANVESASQLTFGLVLACAQKIAGAHRMIKAGEWQRQSLMGLELNGKTYGLIGLGRIGRRVAQLARAFGMEVIAYDPYVEDAAYAQASATRVSLEELLKKADVISLHVPRTKETERLLNRSNFEYINPSAIIVNTSRGTALDEEDLVQALAQGKIAACGLDVFEKEPLPRQSKLLNFPEVLLTPHIGANTVEAFQKASDQAAEKIIRFFVDGSTSDTLPPKAAWFHHEGPVS